MERNYSNIWTKFPQYKEENTLMISNYRNMIDDFQTNDIVLPYYDPKAGHTDFLDDKHFQWLHNYVNFLEGFELKEVSDVRSAMSTMSYDNYLKRTNKTMKYDSYKSSDGGDGTPMFWI